MEGNTETRFDIQLGKRKKTTKWGNVRDKDLSLYAERGKLLKIHTVIVLCSVKVAVSLDKNNAPAT